MEGQNKNGFNLLKINDLVPFFSNWHYDDLTTKDDISRHLLKLPTCIRDIPPSKGTYPPWTVAFI